MAGMLRVYKKMRPGKTGRIRCKIGTDYYVFRFFIKSEESRKFREFFDILSSNLIEGGGN